MRPAYSIIALNAPVGGLEPGRRPAAGPATGRHAPSWVGVGPPSRAPRSTSTRRTGHRPAAGPPRCDQPHPAPPLPGGRREMAPFRQRTIYEVNSELSFYQLNEDVPMQWSKHSEKGMEERRALLEEKVPGALRIIDAEVPGATAVAPSRCRGHPLDRADGSLPRPRSGSRWIRSGTSRDSGWRSFAERRSDGRQRRRPPQSE